MLLLGCASVPSFAQTTYSWTSGTTGGTWSTAGNWTDSSGTGTSYPGSGSGGTGDTAILGNATANRNVLLNATPTNSIATLTITQTTGSVTNELEIGSATNTTLTVTNALSLGATAGNSLIYLDGIDYAGVPKLTDNAGVTIGSGGILELADSTSITTTVTSSTGVTINSGGVLNIDQGIIGGTTGSPITSTMDIAGPLTLNSGATLNMSNNNSGGSAYNNTTGSFYDTRLSISGNFLDAGGTITESHSGTTTTTNEIYVVGTATSATFDSGSTGVGALNGFIWNGSATSFTLASDVALPTVTARPTTTGTDILTLETVTAGGTLSLAGINVFGTGTTITPEISLGSNVSLTSIGIIPTHQSSGSPIIVNANTYTLNVSSGPGVFQTSDQTAGTGNNWTLEGSGGTIEGTYINIANNTNGTTIVNSGLTLEALGGATLTNNLGNLTSGSSIDAASTFEYAGTSATNENYLTTSTSGLAIGNLQVGTGTGTPILGTSSALAVGGGITVNSGASLDLDAHSITESHGTDATAGGLSGSGTVYNGNATTTNATATTLTLDTTDGNGSFSGVIEDHTAGTGTVALAVTGKSGSSQTLSGANTYSGGTTVNGGSLLINNASGSSGTGTGFVSVGNGATLGGSGYIAPTVTAANSFAFASGSTLAPGTYGAGGNTNALTLTAPTGAAAGFVSFAGTVTLDFNLNTSLASSSLALKSSVASELSGLSSSDVFNFYDLSSGHLATGEYTLISTDDTTGNPFGSITTATLSGATINGLSSYTGDTEQLQINQVGSNYELQLDISASAVPEPSTWVMMLGGLGLLLFWQSRRARNSWV